MAQSLAKVLVHIVFSTKDRFAFWVHRELRLQLHAYLAKVFSEYDSPAIIVGGMPDHVHALCRLSRNYSISEIIREVKSNSSKWAKTKGGIMEKFQWQEGYGAFSVGYSQVAQVRDYIKNQFEHHRIRTFQEEYLDFLRGYDVEYDERFIWK